MISDALQFKVHSGDREAFKLLFAEYGKGVYIDAIAALDNEKEARAVVKQAFYRLQNELVAASGPMDADARLHAIANEEIALAKRPASVWNQSQTGGGHAKTAPETRAGDMSETMESGWWIQPTDEIFYNEEPVPSAAHQTEVEQPAAEQQASLYAQPPVPTRSNRRKDRKAGWIFLVIFVILLACILVWLVAGILMDLAIIPYAPLGYDWFNENIYPFFWQSA